VSSPKKAQNSFIEACPKASYQQIQLKTSDISEKKLKKLLRAFKLLLLEILKAFLFILAINSKSLPTTTTNYFAEGE
jgi:hypothetical protein